MITERTSIYRERKKIIIFKLTGILSESVFILDTSIASHFANFKRFVVFLNC